jgi:hypothetical protein
MPRKKRRTESTQIKISSCRKFLSEVERFAEALEKEVEEFLEILHLLKTGTEPTMSFDLNDAKNLISILLQKFAYMTNGNVYFPVSDLTDLQELYWTVACASNLPCIDYGCRMFQKRYEQYASTQINDKKRLESYFLSRKSISGVLDDLRFLNDVMKSIKTSKVTQKSIEDLCCKIVRLQSKMVDFSKEDMKELEETLNAFLANLPESLSAYVAKLSDEKNSVAASINPEAKESIKNLQDCCKRFVEQLQSKNVIDIMSDLFFKIPPKRFTFEWIFRNHSNIPISIPIPLIVHFLNCFHEAKRCDIGRKCFVLPELYDLISKLDKRVSNWESNLMAAWDILVKCAFASIRTTVFKERLLIVVPHTVTNPTAALLVVANLHKIEVLRLSIIIIINVDYYEFLIHCFLVGCFIRKTCGSR